MDETEQEFRDRFGPLPPPVADMFYLLRVKMLAKSRFLRGIESTGNDLIIKMSPFVVSDRLALYKAFGVNSRGELLARFLSMSGAGADGAAAISR